MSEMRAGLDRRTFLAGAAAAGASLVRADRVVCGTDGPQGRVVMKPVEYVEAIPDITARERELILCENPARLLTA